MAPFNDSALAIVAAHLTGIHPQWPSKSSSLGGGKIHTTLTMNSCARQGGVSAMAQLFSLSSSLSLSLSLSLSSSLSLPHDSSQVNCSYEFYSEHLNRERVVFFIFYTRTLCNITFMSHPILGHF